MINIYKNTCTSYDNAEESNIYTPSKQGSFDECDRDIISREQGAIKKY